MLNLYMAEASPVFGGHVSKRREVVVKRAAAHSLTILAYLVVFGFNASAGMRCSCGNESHIIPSWVCGAGIQTGYLSEGISPCHARESRHCCNGVEQGSTHTLFHNDLPAENGSSPVPCRCSVHASPTDNKYHLADYRTNDNREYSSFSEMALSHEHNLFPLEIRRELSHSGFSPPHRLLHRCLILIV